MFKKISIFICLLFSFSSFSFANEEILDLINSYEIIYSDNVLAGDELKINLTKLDLDIDAKFPDSNIDFEWDLGDDIRKGRTLKKVFNVVGNKEFDLNIYDIDSENSKTKLLTKKFNIFIYDKTLPLIISDEVKDEVLASYIDSFKVYGVKVDVLGRLSRSDLELFSILPSLDEYNLKLGEKSDYLTIWGGKDFVFDVISKFNREVQLYSNNVQEKEFKYSLYVLSTFNINVMSSYLENFLGNKPWIDKLLITSEQSQYKIIENANRIDEIQQSLNNSGFSYIDVTFSDSKLSNINFVSKFISNFSNKGYDVNSIYIILIIPFVLTIISFFKHFIGFSTTGILVPLFMVILGIKIGFVETLSVFGILIIFNLVLSRIFSNYALLYTPKISMLIIANLLLFILMFNISDSYGLVDFTVTDSIYMVLFILISERLIGLVTSKEFSEYKSSLLITAIVSGICYFIFSYPEIKVLILAYPEILVILLPLNFLIGRFTGLRVTEYFRFREIIKNIEE